MNQSFKMYSLKVCEKTKIYWKFLEIFLGYAHGCTYITLIYCGISKWLLLGLIRLGHSLVSHSPERDLIF